MTPKLIFLTMTYAEVVEEVIGMIQFFESSNLLEEGSP